MVTTLVERFSYDYQNGAGGSLLVVKVSTDDTFINYQVEMMARNEIQGILPLKMKQKDDFYFLYYDITSKIQLRQFLKRARLRKEDFISILLQIAKILLDCRYYLLYDRCFLIDEEYIFINPETLELSLVYVPFSTDTNINEIFKDFIMDLIMKKANIVENDGDDFLHKIIESIKKDTFCINEFYTVLARIKSGNQECIIHDNISVNSIKDTKEVFPVRLFKRLFLSSRFVEENIQTTSSVDNSCKIVPEAVPVQRSNKTVLLSFDGKKPARFKNISGNPQEEIVIDKSGFIIGRLKGQVDFFVESDAIGKFHAEITIHDGTYYIKDLNSKNGTFINENRIECSKEYEIKENDKITLANREYLFIIH